MANLDVVVIDAHQYTQEALINCWTCWTKIRMSHWKSIVFHEGVYEYDSS